MLNKVGLIGNLGPNPIIRRPSETRKAGHVNLACSTRTGAGRIRTAIPKRRHSGIRLSSGDPKLTLPNDRSRRVSSSMSKGA